MGYFPVIDALAFVMLFLYKIALTVAGTLIIYMGYRLFHQGIVKGGAQEFRFGKWLSVHGGGPGIVFAGLGCIVLVTSMLQKSEYKGARDEGGGYGPEVSMMQVDPSEMGDWYAYDEGDDDDSAWGWPEEPESPPPSSTGGSP